MIISGSSGLHCRYCPCCRSNGDQEAGETGEYLPYRRQRRKPNSRPSAKNDPNRLVVSDNERLLLIKRFIDLYNEGDLVGCKDFLTENIPYDCYVEIASLGIVVRKLPTLFTLMDAVVNSFPDGLLLASDTTINHEAAVHTRFKFNGVQVLDFTETLLREIVAKEEAEAFCFPCGPGSANGFDSARSSSMVGSVGGSGPSEGESEEAASSGSVNNGTQGINLMSLSTEYSRFPSFSSSAHSVAQDSPRPGAINHNALMMPVNSSSAMYVPSAFHPSELNGDGQYMAESRFGVDDDEDEDAVDDGYVDNDRFLTLTRVIEQDIAEQLQQPLLLSSNQLTLVRPNSVEFVGVIEMLLNSDFSVKSIVINRSARTV
jgi:hypothetical protein